LIHGNTCVGHTLFLKKKRKCFKLLAMRRIAAAILLCVFGAMLPTATVVSLAAPDLLIPVCCRTHGAHHCMMMAMMGGVAAAASGPQLSPPGCPYRYGFHPFTQSPVTAAEQSRSGTALALALFSQASTYRAVLSLRFARAVPRGPPAPILHA
jgi:hypothetical protein